jgi:hypothetical protein
MPHLSLGPVPAEEDCAQVGSRDYAGRARAECKRYIALLRECFGHEPEGAGFRVTRNPHDFGEYLDVVVAYDPAVPGALEYALRVEAEAPTRWDTET